MDLSLGEIVLLVRVVWWKGSQPSCSCRYQTCGFTSDLPVTSGFHSSKFLGVSGVAVVVERCGSVL